MIVAINRILFFLSINFDILTQPRKGRSIKVFQVVLDGKYVFKLISVSLELVFCDFLKWEISN